MGSVIFSINLMIRYYYIFLFNRKLEFEDLKVVLWIKLVSNGNMKIFILEYCLVVRKIKNFE